MANEKAKSAGVTAATCPKCNKHVQGLLRIDASLRSRISAARGGEVIPQAVCQSCYLQLSAGMSQGAQLRATENAKDQNKIMMWKNRMTLVKTARSHMASKMYTDAATAYEQYLSILEMGNKVGPGGLTPELFRKGGAAKELAVVSTVYFELLKIYDLSTKMSEKGNATAKKLGEFAKASPGGQPLLRQVATFAKSAKNPQFFQEALKTANFTQASCFVATAAFQDFDAPEVVLLRRFRDRVLIKKASGRLFISVYYRFSPSLAQVIDRNRILRSGTRFVLRGIASGLSKRFDLHSNTEI